VLKNLEQITESGVQVIWQTGAYYFEQIQNETKNNKPGNLQIHQFLTRMDFAYSAADVVISRAGAGTISELCLVGKPAILVPSPNVSEDHQTKNAMALVEKDAAVMLTDKEIDEKLFQVAFDMVTNNELCQLMATNIRTLAKPEATKTIVDEVEKLIVK
jgi:UDP-N-acetylglucosamine--N-acetylmuramyl-(pentapeptide) pyrophosphoryl-undecaprenol N-acetylglucosamine transferase